MNLLIVDDTPTSLKLLRVQLEAEGHTVFEAHDGVDALALLERQRVDVVISDILMPRMDGYRLSYEIRKHARLHDLPIILCTSSYTSSDDEKLALHVGADKYLKRPISLETLVAALQEAIAMPHAAPRPKALQEVEVLMEYSERLVSKLEEKNTELQAQTEALRASEERYRLLFERAPDVIFALTPMGAIASLNHAFETITGWPPAQWLGRPFQDLIHTDDQTRAGELFQLVLGGERVPTFELRVRTVAGGFRDVEFTGFSSELSGGRIEVQGIGRDITERRQSEAALREREARLRAIIDNEPECVKVVDKDGLILEMNPAGLRMIEADSLLQVQNKGINRIIVEEHRAAFSALLRKTLQGESGILEFDIIGLKGTRRTLDTHAVPLRDERGEVTALLGITRDITEHKRAEALLNGQKQVLELIATGAPLGESLTALVRLVEAHAPGILGSILLLDEDGVHLRDGASPSLPPEYVAAIEGMSIGPSAGSCGTAAYSKETVVVEDIATDPRWAEYKAVALPHGLRACWSTPIFDAQRRVFGTFAMYYRQPALPQPAHQRLIEIAAHTAAIAIGRHRTETALRKSVERLRFAIQASNVGFWDWDLRTNHVIYSREWKSQLGYEETEIRNELSEWERLVHPDDLAAAQQRIQRYLAQPERAYEVEFRMRHKDGTWRWIYARGEFFRDASGEAVRLMGCHIDLTERKQAEEEILRLNAELEERVRQRTAQLQAANLELEAFSYSVSHDLRTPLSAIDGFSDLLDKEIGASPATERSTHYLARIRAGVLQMNALIDALLSLAEVSRTSLHWSSVDLSAMAQTVLNGYQEREPGRAAQWDIQPGLIVQGDSQLLLQVLDNLLGNAWKFSGKQPKTRIAFGRENGQVGEAVYAVRDNGAGFDMALSEKLFGAFQRLHAVSEFPGTGIGLATVHRIVTRHGGRVWAESVAGQGTAFYFTLGPPPT